jgi:hypothetical protein
VIALGMPSGQWATHEKWYGAAFREALAPLLGLSPEALVIDDFQPSSVGTVSIYFSLIMPSSSSSSSEALLAAAGAVRALFGSAAAGAPALPPLIAALQAAGLPVMEAHYIDQLSPDVAALDASGVASGTIASWSKADWGQAVALDVPHDTFAQHERAWMEAVAVAVARCLNASADTVIPFTFQPSSVNTVIIYFDVLIGTSSSSSNALVADAMSLASLFTSDTAGSPAIPAFIAALHAEGLTMVNNAYFIDQFVAPPATTLGRKLLGRLRRLGR